VGVHLRYYRDQGPDRKLISSVNILVHSEDHDWNLVRQGLRAVTAPPGGPSAWLEAELLGAAAVGEVNRKSTVKLRRVYWVGGRWTPSEVQAKLWGAWLQLRGEPDDAAALILSAEERPGQPADQALDAFTAANSDMLQGLLMQARGR